MRIASISILCYLAAYYEEQHRQRVVKNLKRKAAKLGMKVVPVEV